MTARIPHPYPPQDAGALRLRGAQGECRRARAAARHHAEGQAQCPHRHGRRSGPSPEDGGPTLGYWLGIPYWGQGYATEAARALIDAFFAYTRGTGARGVGAGHQPGLAAGAREVRLRLSRLGARPSSKARGGLFPVDHFRLDRRAWESLKAWGHTGFVREAPSGEALTELAS